MFVLSGFERTNSIVWCRWRRGTPVPIPNTEVKLFSADGSRGIRPVRVGRRQASRSLPIGSGFFLFIFLIFNVKVILLDTRCLGKVQSYFTWSSRVGCGTNNNQGKAASIWIQLFLFDLIKLRQPDVI